MTEQTLQQLGRLLADAEHIAVLTGAGMSTESGIPDFRSADGLWSRDRSLADVVSINYFREQPEAFWQAFKDIFRIKLMRDYLPNDGHHFLAALEQAYKRVSVLTQNIDGLHHRVKQPPRAGTAWHLAHRQLPVLWRGA
ncbi:SIR2 family NAD-dependent protein deacylase [Paludibacterium denitrificans]|uniref:SIR2 family NAD-dependent protein deacylase n=1 Tax=Paludibacterium denitrificans TaxID=2675226 RepID=UPI00247811D4|nr:Sir2 family NAD-dependent protein deacetylase [Paludibacterium denitrificans]